MHKASDDFAHEPFRFPKEQRAAGNLMQKMEFFPDAEERSAFLIYLAAMFCAVFITTAFLPGFMSYDTYSQYRQVIGQESLSDAHPVVMVYLWRALLRIANQPGVMLAFHQTVYWSAIAVFSCAVSRRIGVRAVLFVIIGFCPPLIIQSLHLWKDVGMMSALAMATAALLASIQTRHWAWYVLAGISLFYASAVRHNGFIAAIPLLIFLCTQIAFANNANKRRAILKTAFLAGLICISYYGLMKRLNAGIEHSYGIGTIIVWDMAAISVEKNIDLLPSYLERKSNGQFLQDLKGKFSHSGNNSSFEVISPYPPKNKESQLILDWGSLVLKDPVLYLKHRIAVFKTLFGIQQDHVYYPFQMGLGENEFGFKFLSMTEEQSNRRIASFGMISESILYRPWLYLLICAVVAAIAIARYVKAKLLGTREFLAFITALSGLSTAGSLFFLAPAADYRFITWTIFSAVLSASILCIDLLSERFPALRK